MKKKNFYVNEEAKISPTTDLHCHMLGILPSKKMVEIGIKNNIMIPVNHLKMMKIDTDKYLLNDEQCIPLKILNKNDLNKYTKNLSYVYSKKNQFKNLDNSYYFRSIYFKNSDLLYQLFYEISLFYKKFGINYVEMSNKWFYDDEMNKFLLKNLPELEKKTGVRLRFLAAIDKKYDKEKLEFLFNKLVENSSNYFLVGCDFLGDEKFPIENIEDFIKKITNYSILNNNRFCIRCHVGEIKENNNGIFKFLSILKNIKQNLNNYNLKFPEIRIGHGIYGMNNYCINLCKELDVIIELNLTSNLKLHNIEKVADYPLQSYIDNNLNFVIGTDSPGIFKTNIKKELKLAKKIGLNHEQLNKIKLLENVIKK